MRLFLRFQSLARRFPDRTGVLALAFLTVLVFWPLLTGRAYFFGDLELYFVPLSEFWRRELLQGRLPLWNPHSFGGAAFAGNPQIGLLYPPSLLLLFFPTAMALSLGLILHVFCSGASFFLWQRRGRCRLGAQAAFLGASVWMLGGVFLSKAQFPNMLAALAWLPAVMWSAEIIATRPNFRSAAVLGAVLGLQLLAAHAQVSLYSVYLALFYALCVRRGSLLKIGAAFAFALFLAALLDAGQLLPVIENLRGAQRQTLSLATAPRFVLPPWALSNLFSPYLYGSPARGTWTFHGGGNFWETACYLGVLPFFLAMWGCKRAKFWTFAAILSLILALGPLGGLYIAAFRMVPGIARFHDAARFLIVVGFAWPVLAATGFQNLKNSSKMRYLAPLILLLSVLDLAVFARGIYPTRLVSQIAPPERFIGASDAMLRQNQARIWSQNPKQSRALLLNYADYRTRTPQNDAIFALGAIPNTQIWSGLLEAGGYDPIAPLSAQNRLETLRNSHGVEALSRSSIRFVSLWSEKPPRNAEGLTEIYRSPQTREGLRFFVLRNENCLPRARFLGAGKTWRAAKITGENSNFLEIEFPFAATHFELADSYSPAWKAFESGREIPVHATPDGFFSLALRPETRQIRLVYEAQSFRTGTFLFLCGLSFLAALVFCRPRNGTP